jgi:ABC-type nitrate/sulfonate/bicarbonate transport system substrate-binding protein
MLLSGSADVNVLPLDRALEVTAKDDSFIIVANPVRKLLFALIGRNSIKTVNDLRGKTVAVSQIGDATYTYALRLLNRFGIGPHDVHILTAGTGSRAAALETGIADATMLSAPAYFKFEKAGYTNVANAIDYDDITIPSVLLLRKKRVISDPRLPERLLRSHAFATQRFYDDKPFAVHAFLAHDKQEYSDVERAYDEYRRREAFDRVAYISAEAMDSLITTSLDPSQSAFVRAFDYRRIIDNSDVDQLIQTGFYRELFGKQIQVEEQREERLAFR